MSLHCKKCGRSLRRIAREGLLRVKVYPIFGFYPWECPICRKVTMHRKQYKRKPKSAQEGSAD